MVTWRGSKPGCEGLRGFKALEEQARAHQRDDGQGDLGHHERTAQSHRAYASGAAAPLGLERLVDVRAGRRGSAGARPASTATATARTSVNANTLRSRAVGSSA